MGCASSINKYEVVSQHSKLPTEVSILSQSSKALDLHSPSDKNDSKSKQAEDFEGVTVTEDMIKEFEALNVNISGLERKNILQCLETMEMQQSELQKEIADLDKQHQALDSKMQKEFQDLKSLKSIAQSASIYKYFASYYDFQQRFSKEEEEFIQAKTEQENCYGHLLKLQKQKSKLTDEIHKVNKEKKKLLALYEKQDEILEQVFNGTYASTLEDELESDRDKMEDKKQRVKVASDCWKHCEGLVKVSTGQLEFACKRWFDIKQISSDESHQVVRVQAISAVRSHLIAALQNLSNAQRYLHPVTFPYCDANEVETLRKAISFIYIDGMLRERHDHAHHVFQTMHARSIMLQKWVRNVTDQKISYDIAQVCDKCKACKQALRSERIRLMTIKLVEHTGNKIRGDKISIYDANEENDEENEETIRVDDVTEAEEVEGEENMDQQFEQAKADELIGERQGNTEIVAAFIETDELNETNNTSLDKLAPFPSTNEIFGDLDSLLSAYDRQKQHADKQEGTTSKLQTFRKNNLRTRRSWKVRLEARESQAEY